VQRSTYNANLSMTFNPLRFVVAAPTIPKPREQQVAEAAYFIALKRGFVPGYEAQDWAAAEKELAEANVSTTSHE
jgi:hypothetical protein